jgi:hypothetical protein
MNGRMEEADQKLVLVTMVVLVVEDDEGVF